MPLTPATCTQCGATLEVDSAQQAAICPFCQTAFVIEQAINNYKINITGGEIHLHDQSSIEVRLNNADTFLNKLDDYEKAMKIYKGITDDAPDNYMGWFGCAKVKSKKFTWFDCEAYHFLEISFFFNRALIVAPDDKKQELSDIWNTFCQKCLLKINDKKQQIDQLQNQKQGLQAEIANMGNRILENDNVINDKTKKKKISFAFRLKYRGFLAGMILVVLFPIPIIAYIFDTKLGKEIDQRCGDNTSLRNVQEGKRRQIEAIDKQINILSEYVYEPK